MTTRPPADDAVGRPRIIRLYLASNRFLGALTHLVRMLHIGVWLGILTRPQLHAASEWRHDRDQRYRTVEYNNSGLFAWERTAIDRSFAGCRRLLVTSAGGGREVIALRQRGFEIEAFESDPGLVRFANDLLERQGMPANVRLAPWDGCPDYDVSFDGIVVGWGSYALIRGRERRVGFLRDLRNRVAPGAPILLSFNSRQESARHFRVIARIANLVASVLRRDEVEVGDTLVPNYSHYFTRAQLESEMLAGGFELVSYELDEYGHAIGRAA